MDLICSVLAAGAAGLGVGGAYWRGRAAYGRGRGLPPGSLGFGASLRSLFDDRFYLEQASRYGPVFKTSQFHHRVICIVGLPRAARFLQSHEDDLRAPPLPFDRVIPRGFLRYMHGDDHARYSPLFRAALSPSLVRSSEPFIAACWRRELVRMATDSDAARGAGVPIDPYLGHVVFSVLARVLLGVAPDTPEFTELERIYRGMDHRQSLLGAHRENRRRIEQLAALLRKRPVAGGAAGCAAAELISMVDRLVEDGPDALDDPTVAGNLTFMFQIARDNVTGLLRWVVKEIADDPRRLARVRDALAVAPACSHDAAQHVVQETLRLEQSEFIYRIAQRDLEIDGYSIPKGWLIRICVRESHRSPEVFDAPEMFDPGRFAVRQPPKIEYSPFGMGRHACIGAQLTTAIARALVAELARGYELSLAADGPRVRRRWRHWTHWAPSPNLRLVVRSRDGALAGMDS